MGLLEVEPSCPGVTVGGSGIGASCPLPSAPTKVRLLNRLPTLDLGGRDYSSCLGFSDACPSLTVRRARGQASEKPQGRKPRGEFAPAVVSVYGDLASM